MFFSLYVAVCIGEIVSFGGSGSQYKDYASALEENANKFREISLKKTAFGAWLNMFNKEKHALWEKQKTADQYNDR